MIGFFALPFPFFCPFLPGGNNTRLATLETVPTTLERDGFDPATPTCTGFAPVFVAARVATFFLPDTAEDFDANRMAPFGPMVTPPAAPEDDSGGGGAVS